MGERENADGVDVSSLEVWFDSALRGRDFEVISTAARKLADAYNAEEKSNLALEVLGLALDRAPEGSASSARAELEGALGTVLHYELNRSADSLEHLTHAVSAFEELGNAKRTADMRYNLGHALSAAGRYAEAVDCLALAGLGFEQIDHGLDGADCHVALALCRAAEGQQDLAEREVRIAMELAEVGGETARPLHYLKGLARAHEWAGLHLVVEWAFRTVVQLSDSSGSPDQAAEALGELAYLYARTGRPEMALQTVEEALRRLHASPGLRPRALLQKAELLVTQFAKVDEAEQLAREAELEIARCGDPEEIDWHSGLVNLTRAAIRRATGDMAVAADLAREAAEDFRQAGASELAAIAGHDRGVALLALGRAEEAADTFAGLLPEAPTPWVRAIVLMNLGVAQLQLGEPAIASLEAAHVLHSWLPPHGIRAALNLAFALAVQAPPRIAEARDLVQHAVVRVDELAPELKAGLLWQSAMVLDEWDPEGAVETLQAARRAALSVNDHFTSAMCSRRLGELFADGRRWQEAVKEFRCAATDFEVCGTVFHLAETDLSLGKALLLVFDERSETTTGEADLGVVEEAIQLLIPALLAAETFARTTRSQYYRSIRMEDAAYDRAFALLGATYAPDATLAAELLEYFSSIGAPNLLDIPNEPSWRRHSRLAPWELEMGDVMIGDQDDEDWPLAATMSAGLTSLLDTGDDLPVALPPTIVMPYGEVALARFVERALSRYGVRPFSEQTVRIGSGAY